MLHNALGESIPLNDLVKWEPSPWRAFHSNAVSWLVDGVSYRLEEIESITVTLLPDASGFICFESQRHIDNCRLLDVYGKERIRLTVPYVLTGKDIPADAEMWFRNVSEPYVNPQNDKKGQFGVTVWIEYAGDYYFELDWHSGHFLWGKPIRF